MKQTRETTTQASQGQLPTVFGRFLRIYAAATTLCIVLAFALLLTATASHAIDVATSEIQITSGPNSNTGPILVEDVASRLVVYTSLDGPTSKVIYQRYGSTGTLGPAISISGGSDRNVLNDVSGDHIIYTAFIDQSTGVLFRYSISTGLSDAISPLAEIVNARIHGDRVVWVENALGTSRVMFFDLTQLGKPGAAPALIAGPLQPNVNVDIGNTLIVWDELTDGQYDVGAYDMRNGMRFSVTADSALNEGEPSTAGSWVAWQEPDPNLGIRIKLLNVDTREARTVAADGGLNMFPSMDGNFLAWEGNSTGNMEIYLYSITADLVFQLTNHGADQRLNNLFGNSVAYADVRNGNVDVFVSIFHFLAPVANAGKDQDIYLNKAITLNGSFSSIPPEQNVTYEWTIDKAPTGSIANLSEPTSANPTFTPDLLGSYVLQLKVFDGYKWSLPSTVAINVFQDLPPIVTVGASTTAGLTPLPVTFNTSGKTIPEGGGLTYVWDFGDGNTGMGANPTHTYFDPGSYIASVSVQDNFGKITTADLVINVHAPNSQPSATPKADQAQGPAPLSISFTSNATDLENDPISYLWSFGDGSTSDLADPIHTFTTPGTYLVTLDATDNASTPTGQQKTLTILVEEPSSNLTFSTRHAIIKIKKGKKHDDDCKESNVDDDDEKEDDCSRYETGRIKLQLKADISMNQPAASDIITLSVEGTKIFSAPLNAFEQEGAGRYELELDDLEVKLDLVKGFLKVHGERLRLPDLDATNEIELVFSVGSATALENLTMTPKSSKKMIYRR